jgi:hypothetical protein
LPILAVAFVMAAIRVAIVVLVVAAPVSLLHPGGLSGSAA